MSYKEDRDWTIFAHAGLNQWRHQKFICGGHRGGQKSKNCRKWLSLAIFSSDGGQVGGTEPPTGGYLPHPHAPLMPPLVLMPSATIFDCFLRGEIICYAKQTNKQTTTTTSTTTTTIILTHLSKRKVSSIFDCFLRGEIICYAKQRNKQTNKQQQQQQHQQQKQQS